MTILKFTDGVNIDTSGSVRKLELSDGWYIVGQGMSIPMSNEEACNQYLEDHG